MKEVNLVQGSQEWLDYRKTKITATKAAAIMNMSNYESRQDCWEEFIGLSKPKKETEAMREGRRLEPIALKWYCGIDESFKPIVAEHDEISYLSASLDGISIDRKRAVEIKCGKMSYQLATQGIVPDYYECQCQHIMLVCDIEMVDYVAFDEISNSGIIFPRLRNDEFISKLLKEYERFWYCVNNFINPRTFSKKHEYDTA